MVLSYPMISVSGCLQVAVLLGSLPTWAPILDCSSCSMAHHKCSHEVCCTVCCIKVRKHVIQLVVHRFKEGKTDQVS